MNTAAIQRQYNEVIAANYDLDPQDVTKRALDLAIDHLQRAACLDAGLPPLRVLDLGMGTGLFFERLRTASQRDVRPAGLDVSEKMVEIAKSRIVDLEAVIDDAANFADHFEDESFDLICTHFITGFVAIDHLAPRIWNKLKPGGYWSFVGGTSGAFPTLQRKSNSPVVRLFSRGRRFNGEKLLTPVDRNAVLRCFRHNGFQTCSSETFEPNLRFNDFDDFMEFAYRGGWLTPFIEELGLHVAKPLLRKVLSALVFPMDDRHRIVVGLTRRPVE
jgi:SAM-dependent methyltransferase